MAEPRFGDRVRVRCTATGRYLRDGLALFVSAMSNELCIDRVAEGEPHPTLPVPSDDAIAGAFEALTYARVEQRRA